jgi:hypothetical protein
MVLVETRKSPAELRHLLDNPAYRQRASEVGEQVRQEDGVWAACDALERLLQAARPGRATLGAGGFFCGGAFLKTAFAKVFSLDLGGSGTGIDYFGTVPPGGFFAGACLKIPGSIFDQFFAHKEITP